MPVNSTFWLIDFKIPLVSHGLLLLVLSFRLRLVIDTCLSSISVGYIDMLVYLLDKSWKDLYTLPSKILRVYIIPVYFFKVCNMFFRIKILKILLVDIFLWVLYYCVIGYD